MIPIVTWHHSMCSFGYFVYCPSPPLDCNHHRSVSSVTQSCPTLCHPMNCSMLGLPVHHQLPESTQTHVHWVGDAIQPSHPLLSSSLPALNLSQHQGLFKWVIRRGFRLLLYLQRGGSVLVECPCCPRDSRVFTNTTVQKHQFFSVQHSLCSNSHIHTWLLEKTQLWLHRTLSAKSCLCFLICSLCWS